MGRTISKKEKVTAQLSIAEDAVATGLFIGYVPFAPATWACGISVIIWYLVHSVPWLYIAITVLLFMYGVVLARKSEQVYGNDPHCVVIDEYASFLIPLFFVPRSAILIAVAFLAFRIFDIVKPPPLRALEKVGHGWGIMLDDLGAAVYTSVIVIALRIALAP